MKPEREYKIKEDFAKLLTEVMCTMKVFKKTSEDMLYEGRVIMNPHAINELFSFPTQNQN